MKIPFSWLKEYISLSLSPEQIAEQLTQLGLEVDSITRSPLPFQGVFVGKVLEATQHPNADKLRVATVSDGQETFQVVCGASNCRAGIKVAFARIGAALQDKEGKTFKIKKSALRGVDSYGMLCSAEELQFAEQSEGILELPEESLVGMDLQEIYGDVIFEISLTPNLGHALSVLGVARELSAANNVPIHPRKISFTEGEISTESQIRVSLDDSVNCPRYACRILQGVTVAPSPEGVQRRLIASGMRPVNNVVDATNLVMIELGHPLHAFDYHRLPAKEIHVRNAQEGESLITLDGVKRQLNETILTICSGTEPVAIAGVMGGQNSEVTAETTTILLEAAYFNPGAVRRTSKALSLQTEGSKRFERGADPQGLHAALNLAAIMIQSMAGGTIAKGIVEKQGKMPTQKKLSCRLSRLNALIGTQLSLNEVEALFSRLRFDVSTEGTELLHVVVPTYRNDVVAEIDLIEEAARLYGYQNIPLNPVAYHASSAPHTSLFLFERKIRSSLISEGLQEFVTCDLISPASRQLIDSNAIPEEHWVQLLHPSSIEHSVMRPSLLPGLLQVLKHNFSRQNRDLSGFEIGRVHYHEGDRFQEPTLAGILMSGLSRSPHWDVKPAPVDFYDIKGIIENLLRGLGIENWSCKTSSHTSFHPGRQAALWIEDLEVGTLGELHPTLLRQLDIDTKVLFAEINLQDLISKCLPKNAVQELSLFPGSERDWTLTLPESVPAEEILNAIANVPSRLLQKVSVLDIYRSDTIGPAHKNLTLRFIYRDLKKTLSVETVEAEHSRIIKSVKIAL